MNKYYSVEEMLANIRKPTIKDRARWFLENLCELPFRIQSKIKHFYQRRTRGFDDTELWNLDYTIMRHIEKEDWNELGSVATLYLAINQIGYINRYKELHNIKRSLMFHYGKQFRKYSDFIMPRLNEFKKDLNGYPSELESLEEWQQVLDKMDINTDEGLELFITYFEGLWD